MQIPEVYLKRENGQIVKLDVQSISVEGGAFNNSCIYDIAATSNPEAVDNMGLLKDESACTPHKEEINMQINFEKIEGVFTIESQTEGSLIDIKIVAQFIDSQETMKESMTIAAGERETLSDVIRNGVRDLFINMENKLMERQKISELEAKLKDIKENV